MSNISSELRAATPEIETTEGRYRGIARPDSFAYLGMPFAAAPIGENRFMPPRAAEGFSGVRPATEFGATPQRRPWGDVSTIPEYVVPGDSTLNVNVFTPAPGDESALLPVYVWIHGGGYFSGSIACPWYDGRAFNRDGIVTVSLSYRLAFDGFGWIEDAPLNRGVLDQIAALRWVRANIRAFGGDPDNVTIGGQSAGAGSVMTLLAAPSAVDLFGRVIAHSPAVPSTTVAQAEEVGRLFASEFGVAPTVAGWSTIAERDIVARERQVNHPVGFDAASESAQDIVAACRRQGVTSLGLIFAPVQDDEIVFGLDEALRGPGVADKELLIGSTKDEFTSADDVDDDGRTIRAVHESGISTEAVALFDAEVDRIGRTHAPNLLVTSRLFRSPITQMVERRRTAGAGSRTWMFDFGHLSAVNGLAVHGYDLPFAWDLRDAEGVDVVLGSTPPASIARAMHGAWTKFIATGEADWPTASGSAVGAMRFDTDSRYDPDAYRLDAALAGGH